MSYPRGFLRDRIAILNRTTPTDGRNARDSAGIGWQTAATVWANVDWSRGKQAMNAGAIDAYAIIIVRTDCHPFINERSRIQHDGKTYQILADTFHPDRHQNQLQFHAQQVQV